MECIRLNFNLVTINFFLLIFKDRNSHLDKDESECPALSTKPIYYITQAKIKGKPGKV